MRRRISRVRTMTLLGGIFLFVALPAAAGHGPRFLISQVQITGGAGKTTHDFVELYNPTGAAVDLNGTRLVKRTATGTTDTTLKSWTESTLVPAHGFYLWANKDFTTLGTTPDATTTGTLADNNGVALRRGAENTGEIIDGVGWGTAANALVEGTAFSQNPGANQSMERKPGGGEGNGVDTGNNASDFFLQIAPSPKNSASVAVPVIKEPEGTNEPKGTKESSGSSVPSVPSVPLPITTSATSGSVVINEFLPDPLGGGNEWVELFNTTSASIDLTGWKLQDGTTDTVKTISGSIPAQGFLVVELTAARLNNSGDRIMLRATEGVLIDGISYGDWNDGNIADNAPAPARAGQAVARRVNGTDTASDKNDFATTDAPTPGSANIIATTTVVPVGGGSAPLSTVVVPNPKILINEFVSDPEDGPEWVELFNAGEVSVDLDDWWLEDGSEAKTKLGGTLVPGHFKVVRDIEGNLNNKGDIIRLKNIKGEVIDRVAFGVWEDGSVLDNTPVAEDPNSVARRKDGVDTDHDAQDFAVTTKVTKGKENVVEGTKVAEGTEEPKVTKVTEVTEVTKVAKESSATPATSDTSATQEFLLAELRDLDLGTRVRVQGTVSVLPGILGIQVFYITTTHNPSPPALPAGRPPLNLRGGDNLGIQVYSSKRAFPELKLGDLVQVQGVLGEAQGERRIKIKEKQDVEVVGHETPPTSYDVDGEELGEELAGALVRVSGTLIDVTRSQVVLDEGQSEIAVSIKKTTDIDTRALVPGMQVSITGIVVPDKNSWRILPRWEKDIVIIEGTIGKGTEGANEPEGTKESSGSSATSVPSVPSAPSGSSAQSHPYAEATALASGGGALAAAAIRRRRLFSAGLRALTFLIRRKDV